MAFAVGPKRGGVQPSMNVTPLVDVVLVLLIIFMVITPLLAAKFSLNVPKKDDRAEPAPPSDAPPPLVLQVRRDGTIRINREAIADADLPVRVARALAAQKDPVLFFGAEADVPFGRAMEVLDRARGAGALTIAVITEELTE